MGGILDDVENNEAVRAADFTEKANPGQVIRLVNANGAAQGSIPEVKKQGIRGYGQHAPGLKLREASIKKPIILYK